VTAHAANAITALRVILTPWLVHIVLRATDSASGWPAVPLFAAVAASDVIDGRVARAAGKVGSWGRAFDHGSDILFILSVLAAYVHRDIVPWWVPAAIAAAFAVYVADSIRHRSPRRTASRIGHAGGVLNYVLIGVLVGNDTLALRLLPEWFLHGVFACVPLYSGAAIGARFLPAATPPSRTATDRRDESPHRPGGPG
jgi:phosphatidylglycerophosphate synthase